MNGKSILRLGDNPQTCLLKFILREFLVLAIIQVVLFRKF